MRKSIYYIVFSLLSLPFLLHAVIPSKQQISFKENLGQVSDQYYKPRPDVLFSGTDGNMNFHLKNTGISYQLYKIEKQEINPAKFKKDHFKEVPPTSNVSIYRIDINWLNSNPNPNIEKGEALPDYDNYYMEVCPNGVTNVKSYKELFYINIYSGINLHYYGKEGQLKYDYIIAPHSDYKQIQIQINGAENISISEKGELIIKTPFGELVEQAPLVIQNGKQLNAKWVVTNNIVSFDIKNVNVNLQLIIDPIVRSWGTYYGGNGDDNAAFVSSDSFGNTYMAGTTASGTNIATSGSHQTTIIGGSSDAFLAKFNSSGVRLWGTYYGGTSTEEGYGCATDLMGNVYLTGLTESVSSIATTGSHQNTIQGASHSPFLVKFNSSGVRQWGTYYGGDSFGNANSCSVDLSGNVYICGASYAASSPTAIATIGSHQPVCGGSYDAFLVKFDSNGVRQWGTYYGGSGNSDIAYSCSTDKFRNVYMCGLTNSNTGTVIATPGSYQPTGNSGFLVKFDSVGVRQWGTYFVLVYACCTDNAGNVFIGGNVGPTSNFTPSIGAAQPVFGGVSDGYIAKFNTNGLIQWATYCGGNDADVVYGCVSDASGNVYAGGQTGSNSGLSTLNSPQPNYGGYYNDAFLASYNSNGIQLWSSYYGGSSDDRGYSCSVNSFGDVFLTGETRSNNSISTPGSHQSVLGSVLFDAFLVKFCSGPSIQINTTNTIVCSGTNCTLTATGALTYTWNTGSNSSSINFTPINTWTVPINNLFYVSGNDINGCPGTNSIVLSVCSSPSISITATNDTICPNQNDTLLTNIIGNTPGSDNYLWNTSAITSSLVISPSVTSVYNVTVTNLYNCKGTQSYSLTVSPCVGIEELIYENHGLNIFPNPTTSDFTIFLYKLNKNTILEIYNTLGQIINRQRLVNLQTKINLSEQTNGIYFVKVIENGNAVYYNKILKQ